MTNRWANLVLFQLGWLASTLGAAHGAPWLGPGVIGTWLAAHLLTLGGEAGRESVLIAAAGALGHGSDSALVLGHALAFAPAAVHGTPSPLWMAGLWMGFATTVPRSLGWLTGRYWLAALAGAIAGPAAYWSGAGLGALLLGPLPGSLVAVGVQWAIALPLLVALAGRIRAGRSPTGGAAVPENDAR